MGELDIESNKGKIQFIENHCPSLKSGDYVIEITQKITANSIEHTFPSPEKKFSKEFTVAGDRFSLKPQEVHAVFPPAGSLGDHSSCLPHIVLNRSTLPWERAAESASVKNDKKAADVIPWLALLLFDEDEHPKPEIKKLSELKDHLNLERGQEDKEKVTTIRVKNDFLKKIIPRKEELKYLAHVRFGVLFSLDSKFIADLNNQELSQEFKNHFKNNQFELSVNTVTSVITKDYKWHIRDRDAGKDYFLKYDGEVEKVHISDKDEVAVIIGNRIPEKNTTSYVHLVSIEGRISENGFEFGDEGETLLVSLYNWKFCCANEKQDFQGLLEGVLKRDDKETNLLRLPINHKNMEVEKRLAMGNTFLPHHSRLGDFKYSIYRGPLIPAKNLLDSIPFSNQTADELILLDEETGLFDISYAAAWELGRLLALQAKSVSISLYNWKRRISQYVHREKQKQQYNHLPGFGNQDESWEKPSIPQEIKPWFQKLMLLKGLPFNYLVPDEKMLPNESIRFFMIDPLWIKCLCQGAFSFGNVSIDDDKGGINLFKNNVWKSFTAPGSGFILRSDVVAGWPDLMVDGYENSCSNDDYIPEKQKLKLLRMEKLSGNTLICIFQGEIKTADIHQKPEALHFGITQGEGESNAFYKNLRNSDGTEKVDSNNQNISIDIQLRKINEHEGKKPRILDISSIVHALNDKKQELGFSKTITSAQFALEMMEGVKKVRYAQVKY